VHHGLYDPPQKHGDQGGARARWDQGQRDLIKGQGRIYAIDEFDNKKRNKIDLPSLATTVKW